MILVALALALLTGAATLPLLRVRPRTGAGWIGASFFLGVTALALWTHLLLFVRIPVSAWTILIGPAALVAIWRGRRFDVEWPRPTLWALPAAAGILFLAAGALSTNLLGYDPELFYVLKAKSILHYGTIWNPDFTDPQRLHIAARRPLLLPSIYADFFLFAGTTDHRMLRLWFVLLHAAAVAWMGDRFRPHPLWLGVLAWLPAFWHDAGGAFTGYGDPMLGILFLLAVDALRTREHALGAVAMAAAVLLKQDSLAFVIAILLATAATRIRDVGRAGLVVSAGLLVAVAWAAISWRFGTSGDIRMEQFTPSALVASLPRWPLVLYRFGSELVRPKHWGVFWVLFVAAVALHARRLDREDARRLLVILLQFLAYVAVIATAFPTAEEIRWATRMESMRLLLCLTPLAWAWVATKAAADAGRPTRVA